MTRSRGAFEQLTRASDSCSFSSPAECNYSAITYTRIEKRTKRKEQCHGVTGQKQDVSKCGGRWREVRTRENYQRTPTKSARTRRSRAELPRIRSFVTRPSPSPMRGDVTWRDATREWWSSMNNSLITLSNELLLPGRVNTETTEQFNWLFRISL